MSRPAPGVGTETSITEFVGPGSHYYIGKFARIQEARGFVWTFNAAAASLGPLWAGARGVWGLFWVAAVGEIFALVQILRGLLGHLGAEGVERARQLRQVANARLGEAAAAAKAGDTATAETFRHIAHNLQQASDLALAQAAQAASGAPVLVMTGLLVLIGLRGLQGLLANTLYERQYTAWRADKRVPSRITAGNLLLAVVLVALTYPLTVYRFTAAQVPEVLRHVPVNRDWFAAAAGWLDFLFEAAYHAGSGGFEGVRNTIRMLVSAFETILLGTPWPVVMSVIIISAWRIAGRRMAIVAAASVGYLAVLGLWDASMQTVALLGTAASACVLFGVPIGIGLSRSRRAYAIARPVLDLMQTMPAMVYLIPAIGFFGTGTPPGILATLVFGMPPVIRLTTLGLQQVPADIREAARAYGASQWQILIDVDLPLAQPAIMAGINQTILMCLSMVVIAALIGAQGLGAVVLGALQNAATGQGLLAGGAILLCAVVIDRLVQSSFGRGRSGSSGR